MNEQLRRAPSPDLLTCFAAIVGDRHAVTDPAALAPYLVEGRGLYHGRTSMLLRPGSVSEVQAILKLANETKTPLVPQGGNTGLVGGQIPFDGELILSLTRLDKIREVDAASNAMTCEAGVVLAKAQEAAAAADRLFPLSLGAEGSCTIGGNLSTNAGGTGALAYGIARDLVLGLEVVLADGRVMNLLSKLKKNNTGYDLRHIFVGAEGTLGIITAAVVKMFPRPRAVETAFIGVPSPAAAVTLLNLAQARVGGTVTSFELIVRDVVEFALRHGHGVRDALTGKHPWYVLMEVSSQHGDGLRESVEQLLADAGANGLIEDATLAASLDHAKAFWHLRHILPEVQKPEGGSIKADVSVPVASVPEFLAEASAAVKAIVPGCRPVPFGHLGDGNVHFNISQPIGADPAQFLARWGEINDAVNKIVLKYNGSISAEHGIGKLKRDSLAKVKDPVALELMRGLKRMLDPNGILNPGKVL
ncbi:MAG TPA: FAD-binding oxidoreductase [Pseudolabrys sp.]|jgi:D-lactate dehydrogenase (cytochrome)|nr:FAD-binding oxidoreductase [Pseudolabrys sp.]